MSGQAGFFDVDERLRRLSDLGDQLEAYAAAVDFEIFRADLNAALAYSDGKKGGRPPFDPVMMFKVLIIFLAIPVGPGDEQPMQDANEDGSARRPSGAVWAQRPG